jgi:hypothetical protein
MMCLCVPFLSCKKKKQEVTPPVVSSPQFLDPSGTIKDFRDNFHDIDYLFNEVLATEDRQFLGKSHLYVDFWYERLGLVKGQIEDRLAFDEAKVYIVGEPQNVSDICVVDLKVEVPNVDRIYLRVPWDREKRQEDLFLEVFKSLREAKQLPMVEKNVRLRLKQDRGRWWLWEDFQGLQEIVKGVDTYSKMIEPIQVTATPDQDGQVYAIQGQLRNKGDRSVLSVQIQLTFMDREGKPLSPPVQETHSFGQNLLEPGYASGFSVMVGGPTPPEWFESWNKKDVTVTVVKTDALPVGYGSNTVQVQNSDTGPSGGPSAPARTPASNVVGR